MEEAIFMYKRIDPYILQGKKTTSMREEKLVGFLTYLQNKRQ